VVLIDDLRLMICDSVKQGPQITDHRSNSHEYRTEGTGEQKFFACIATAPYTVAAPSLEQGFRQPPEDTKPSCYWYWISDNTSREGLTRDLEAMARVGIGGAFIGTLWLPPWEIDITDAARPGKNELEIEVINVWHNRLVGDAKLPPDKRKTFLGAQTVETNAPLQPAGLLGPVKIGSVVSVLVE